MPVHKKVSMALTKGEKSDLKKETVLSEAPEFPFGLSVHLDEDSLEKLKVKELPEAGTEFLMNTTVKVTSVSEHEDEDGTRRSVGLQITEMELLHMGGESDSKGKDNPADRLYGGKRK